MVKHRKVYMHTLSTAEINLIICIWQNIHPRYRNNRNTGRKGFFVKNDHPSGAGATVLLLTNPKHHLPISRMTISRLIVHTLFTNDLIKLLPITEEDPHYLYLIDKYKYKWVINLKQLQKHPQYKEIRIRCALGV